MHIDHIVLGIADLETGIDALEALTGVRAAPGGQHPAWGTHNAILSLGRTQYLEILSPRSDARIARDMQFLTGLAALTPVMWAVRTEDVGETAELLGSIGHETSGIVPGSRTRPDGSVLAWKTFWLSGPAECGLPFFIEWRSGSPHPSESAPGGCELGSIEIAQKDPVRLQDLVRLLALDVEVVGGSDDRLSVGLRGRKGRVDLN